MEEFKTGDVVRLKSGGPAMTVTGMAEADIECCCFSRDSGKNGMLIVELPAAALVKLPDCVQ